MNSLKNQPEGLMVLFFSEMWERFCYYGMRALLVLYLIDSLLKKDIQAFAIYGAYTTLVYAAPVLGGKIADKLLGYKNAVILGGILMAIGEFIILGNSEHWLLLGMGAIVIGNGYFKANISSIVGKLYNEGDARRDSGFTIFYIGINLGALLATLVCAEIGKAYGAQYGFALAGLGMIVGVIIFVSGRKKFEHRAQPPDPVKLHAPWIGPISRFHITLVASVACIPLVYLLIKFHNLVGWLLAIATVYVVTSLIRAGLKEGKIVRDRMIVMLILCLFNIVFWACFEQAGSSLTLFAQRNVNRFIGTWQMGAATTQFFNPAYILIFGSVFSIMWIRLTKINRNPSIPLKFGLGIIQLGCGYMIVLVGGAFLNAQYLVPLLTLVVLYLLHTTGELFISPIGLSMVTKLAPKHMTGTAMGGWFLSFAYSNYVAAMIAMATGFGNGGGSTEISDKNVYTPVSYQEKLNNLDTITARYQISLQTFHSEALQFAALAPQAKSNSSYGKLPEEMLQFSTGITNTFREIRNTIQPLLSDTGKVNPVSWTVLFFFEYKKPYARFLDEYTNNLNQSVSGLNSLSDAVSRLRQGKSQYRNIKNELGGGIDTYEKGLIQIENQLSDFTRTNDKGKIAGASQAIEQAKQQLRDVTAHISWDIYRNVYITIGLITIGIGVLISLISKLLNRLMHGIT